MVKVMIDKMMDVVHDQSLPTIELLQESFPDNKDFMINISTLFDPRYVFLIYAPLLFALNKRVGHRMIIALTLAEWANQILKWLLAGERPYWYVHERFAAPTSGSFNQVEPFNQSSAASEFVAVSNHQQVSHHHHHHHHQQHPQQPQLRQFPVTCELGAGSPSGHAMVTATVWYILIDAYHRGELTPLGRPDYSGATQAPSSTSGQKLAKLSWSIYTIMLLLVSLSRVYLACHFPHQCLCGALLGALLARLVAERLPMERLESRHFVYATCFMFATALGTYWALRALGVDPLWSVDKAMRWCAKKEYIHLDTTPFFSMMRYLGFCLGAGLAYDATKLIESNTNLRAHFESQSQTGVGGSLLARRLLGAALAIGFGQFLLALPAPKANLNLFYAISFVMYTLFSCAIAEPIPNMAKRLVPASCANQCQNNNAKSGQCPVSKQTKTKLRAE